MRRTLLAAGFVVLLFLLAILLLQRCQWSVRCVVGIHEPNTFPTCVSGGYPVTGGNVKSCEAKGAVFHSNDRTLYSQPKLSFVFSYPASLEREEGDWPVLDIVGSGSMLMEIVALEDSSISDIDIRSLLPVSQSGSLDIVRARIDGHPIVSAFPTPLHFEKQSALAIIPIHTTSFGLTDVDFIAIRGKPTLVKAALDSLAFLP